MIGTRKQEWVRSRLREEGTWKKSRNKYLEEFCKGVCRKWSSWLKTYVWSFKADHRQLQRPSLASCQVKVTLPTSDSAQSGYWRFLWQAKLLHRSLVLIQSPPLEAPYLGSLAGMVLRCRELWRLSPCWLSTQYFSTPSPSPSFPPKAQGWQNSRSLSVLGLFAQWYCESFPYC